MSAWWLALTMLWSAGQPATWEAFAREADAAYPDAPTISAAAAVELSSTVAFVDVRSEAERALSMILETSVGRGRVCGYEGAGQGAMRRNSFSIPTSCNAAMRRQNRAICPVVNLTQWVKASGCEITIEISKLRAMMSGQLRFLG